MKSPSKPAERLGLKGKLADLPWVTVTRGAKPPSRHPDAVHSVQTPSDAAKAFSQRQRDVSKK